MRVGPLRVNDGRRAVEAIEMDVAVHGNSLANHTGNASQLDLLPRSAVSPLPVLDQRNRGTRFIGLSVQSVLNTPAATHMGFWSINPYVGCEFGCTYCYARDTHRYAVERSGLPPEPLPDWEAFERRILVKTGAADVLVRTLDPARLGGQALVIGTATDPYQPAERRFR